MTADPDPFEQGQRAARKNIPAEANPYQDGSEQIRRQLKPSEGT
jgi:hypothetical protein